MYNHDHKNLSLALFVYKCLLKEFIYKRFSNQIEFNIDSL